MPFPVLTNTIVKGGILEQTLKEIHSVLLTLLQRWNSALLSLIRDNRNISLWFILFLSSSSDHFELFLIYCWVFSSKYTYSNGSVVTTLHFWHLWEESKLNEVFLDYCSFHGKCFHSELCWVKTHYSLGICISLQTECTDVWRCLHCACYCHVMGIYRTHRPLV